MVNIFDPDGVDCFFELFYKHMSPLGSVLSEHILIVGRFNEIPVSNNGRLPSVHVFLRLFH